MARAIWGAFPIVLLFALAGRAFLFLKEKEPKELYCASRCNFLKFVRLWRVSPRSGAAKQGIAFGEFGNTPNQEPQIKNAK